MHRLLILFAKFHNIIKKKALFIIFVNAVTFTIKAPASQLVVITGPSPYFPNWSPDGIPMTKGDDGVWSYTLTAKKSDEIVYFWMEPGLQTPMPLSQSMTGSEEGTVWYL